MKSYSPTLFRTVPSQTPYGLPFAKIGGSQPQPKTAMAIISGTGKATDFKFDRYIYGVHPSQVKSSQVAFNVVKVTNAQSYNVTMQI